MEYRQWEECNKSLDMNEIKTSDKSNSNTRRNVFQLEQTSNNSWRQQASRLPSMKRNICPLLGYSIYSEIKVLKTKYHAQKILQTKWNFFHHLIAIRQTTDGWQFDAGIDSQHHWRHLVLPVHQSPDCEELSTRQWSSLLWRAILQWLKYQTLVRMVML